MSGFVLGVDLGTGGPRVALAGTDGALLGHEKETVDLRLLAGGGAEQDPDDWWHAILAASRCLRERHPHEYAQVTAICMSSQWGGLVPVDADGRHVHPALTWMDSRGSRYSRTSATTSWTVSARRARSTDRSSRCGEPFISSTVPVRAAAR